MKKIIIIVILLAILAGGGCLVLAALSAFLTAPAASPTPARPTRTPGPTATPVVLEMSGRGDDVIRWTVGGGGLAIVTTTHSGDDNFIIRVYDAAGQLVDIVVNEIGPYSGSAAISIGPGNYTLEITADGTWSIRIERP